MGGLLFLSRRRRRAAGPLMDDLARSTSAVNDRAARPGRPGRPHSTSGAPRPSLWTLLVIALFALLFGALGVGIYGLVGTNRPNLADAAAHVPKQVLDQSVDRTVVGTVANPALTIEGDYVEVRTPSFSVLAVVNGPVVPGEGLPDQMSFTTCTWTISLSHVVGPCPHFRRRLRQHRPRRDRVQAVPCPRGAETALGPADRPTFELPGPGHHAGRRGAHAVGARWRPHSCQVGLPGRERLGT